MGPGAILILLVLLAVVLGVVWLIQRSIKKTEKSGDGSDVVAYLLLALAMGVTGFALVELADTAFPGDSLVFDASEDVATALASLVVAAPFVVFFWRRQADRRELYPASAGWTVYLAIIELVFMTAFAVTAVLFVNALINPDGVSAWTRALVFGGVVVFHELAARKTPPRSDSGELRRVIGSAIGLITGGLGLIGCLAALFGQLVDSTDLTFEPWLAMLIIGAPIWAYRWLRPWHAEPAAPRLTWLVAVSTGSLSATVGALTWILVLILQFVLTDTGSAGRHFEGVPVALAIAVAGAPVWFIHRRGLGEERTDPLRAHEYLMAGIGLVTAVSAATGLTIVALDRNLIVGGGAADIVSSAAVVVVGVVLWRVFTPGPAVMTSVEETTSWPSRFFHLGLGVAFGLVAAGSLITTLFVLLRRLLGSDGESSTLLEPVSILVYTGLATWYLLAGYARTREIGESADIMKPFDVTIVTSHPGMLAARFPKEARLHVVYRGDGVGVIDDEMADAIVAAVGNQPSLVWVDADGFRVAPKASGP